MSNITIGFSKSNTILSKSIRLVQQTDFSHVYIKFWNGHHQEMMYYHADVSMVHFMGETAFKADYVVVEEYELEVSDVVKYDVVKFAIQNAGKPYGFSQLFVILMDHLGLSCGRENGDKAYICSELVAKILLEIAHVKGFKIDKPMDMITPKDIQRYLKAIKDL